MSESKKSWREMLGKAVFWLVIVSIILAVVMTLLLDFISRHGEKMDMSNVIDPPAVSKPDVFSRQDATGSCMELIKRILHDPDSAKFEHSDQSSVKLNGNRAFVIQSVRAKNGFGAMRKKDFACFLEMRGGEIYPVLVAGEGEHLQEVSVLIKTWGFVEK